MLAGAASIDITPPLLVDVLGCVRRVVAPRRALAQLLAMACAPRDGEVTAAIVAADLVGLTTEFADRVRARVARAIGRRPGDVLLSSSHSHAAPWPSTTIKLGGESDGWTETELRYRGSIPDRVASVAVQALDRAVEVRVSRGVGRVPSLAVNRREPTADGRSILGIGATATPPRSHRTSPDSLPTPQPTCSPSSSPSSDR